MVIGAMPSGEVWPDILIFNSQVCISLIKSEIALHTSHHHPHDFCQKQ